MRFTYLDGIRGIAALLVLARHWNQLLGFGFVHSYLAVDVFFLMSGFVIAHAYDARLATGRLDAVGFMAVRLTRLYPTYVLALAACLALVLVRAILMHHGKTGEWLASAAMALAFLPFPVSGKALLFPLNICFWSLSAEVFANAAYAFTRRYLGDRTLAGVALAAAGVLCVLAAATGNVDHGAMLSLVSVVGGMARCLFGIAMGMLMYRHRAALMPRARLIPPWLALALIVAVLTGPSFGRFDPLHDLAAIFLIIPLAVAGAAAREPAPGPIANTMNALGLASYPVYLLHIPVGIVLTNLIPSMHGLQLQIGLLAAAALVVLSIQLDKHVDVPMRNWLRRRMPFHPRPAGV